MKCDIIIPVWNQPEFTRSCIDSIVKNTEYPYRIIVIDNASEPETKRYLEALRKEQGSRFELIRNEDNKGFIKAVNQALGISDAPYVCIMNNDTVAASGWLERMVDFARTHEDVGLINPQCDGHGDTSIDVYALGLAGRKGAYMEMNQCHGFCMLVKREVIEKIGCLDEEYGIGGYDDTDYSMRAHLAGYRCVAVKDAYVWHRLHTSFDKAGNREEWVRRNRKIYYDKWGKHLRVGIMASIGDDGDDTLSRLVAFSYGLTREWAWVHIWINSSQAEASIRDRIGRIASASGYPPHQNIRIDCFDSPAVLFEVILLAKLIERLRKRMRDKAFDAIVFFGRRARILAAVAKLLGVQTVSLQPADDIRWEARGKAMANFIKEQKKMKTNQAARCRK